MASTAPQLDAGNLKILQDQLYYEALMNKKGVDYAQYCDDQQLKTLCNTIARGHKQNYEVLLSYLNSHQ